MSFRTIYGLTYSEKGWRMCNRDECDITRIPGLTLVDTAPLRKGAPLTILGAWLFWYDRNVEEITSSVWGWSATNDVASSNHLAGVAVDVNAPKYPWGRRVMPADRIAKIRAGMALFSLTGRWQDSVIYWGEDWSRADQMHYDLRFKEGDPRNEEFAAKLRGGYLGIYAGGTATPPVPPLPALSRADGYAVRIIAEGRRRGITPKGIQVALATGLVESNITVYANEKLPKSLALPHDAVGRDGLSVGIFQQQVKDTGNGWWWGDEATCMGVESSAGLFYDRLIRLPYNGDSKTPGAFAQQIQGSAFPARYDQRWGEAVALYNRLAATAPTQGDDELADPEVVRKIEAIYRELTQRLPSRSPLRHVGEGVVDTLAGFVLNVDGSQHVEIVTRLAKYGDPDALALLREVADNTEAGREHDAQLAQAILAEVTAKPAPLALRESVPQYSAPTAPQVVYLPTPAQQPVTGESPGAILGRAYDALEALNLSGALSDAEKAPLAALIGVLQTKTQGAAS